MIAHIKEIAVARFKWLDESDFKDGIILCQAIPGATVMQMAAYVGLRVNGFKGALLAYAGFVLPAFALMLVLSILYERANELPKIIALFAGLKVIVVAIVSNATYTFGKGMAKDLRSVLIAACSYVLLFYSISPFIIIIAAGLSGVLLLRSTDTLAASHVSRGKDGRHLKPLALLTIMIAAGVTSLFFIDPKLCTLALLMFKIDLFAFGGGFSSIPLMLHEIVDVWGWMDSKTFMDGIALGQVTPGPIVITSTFVGYLLYGLSGAIVSHAGDIYPFLHACLSPDACIRQTEGVSLFRRCNKGNTRLLCRAPVLRKCKVRT